MNFLNGQMNFLKDQMNFLKGQMNFLKGQMNFLKGQIFTPHCLKDGAGVSDGQDDAISGHQVTDLKVVVICQLTQGVAPAKASPADQRLVPT